MKAALANRSSTCYCDECNEEVYTCDDCENYIDHGDKIYCNSYSGKHYCQSCGCSSNLNNTNRGEE